MQETLVILAVTIMAVGLVTVIIGMREFIEMLAPPEVQPGQAKLSEVTASKES